MSEWFSSEELRKIVDRHYHGTKVALARETGVPAEHLGRILNGHTKLTSLSVADRILTALGLNISVEMEPVRKVEPNPQILGHGGSHYRNDGCRCEICRAAHAATMRDYMARRRERARRLSSCPDERAA